MLGALVAADVHDVAEAVRRHHARLGAAVLEHRVRRDGRPVEDRVERARGDVRARAQLQEPGDHRPPGSSGVERTLWTNTAPDAAVVEHEVRERAADVDADNPHPAAILRRKR